MKIIKSIIIVYFVSSSLVYADSVDTPQGEGISYAGGEYFVDYTSYKGDSGASFIEIYFGIPLEGLSSGNTDIEERFEFNVGAQLIEKTTGEIVARKLTGKTAIITGKETDAKPLSICMVEMVVPPGDYILETGVGDLFSGEIVLFEKEILVRDYYEPETLFAISDLEIVSTYVKDDSDGEFIKGGYRLIPNPTRLLSNKAGELCIYYEYYVDEEDEKAFNVEYIIQQTNGRILSRSMDTLKSVIGDKARVKVFDIEGYPSGSYEVIVKATTDNGEKSYERSKQFVIYNDLTSEELALRTSKYLPYTTSEKTDIRKYLSYIATAEELKAFDALSDEEKPIFVEYFWDKNDPIPETEINEFKNAFFKRYEYANANFSTSFRNGIDTDRGKIYLKYGEPDDIIREPSGLPSELDFDETTWQSEPFVMWEYFITGDLEWFLFVDSSGDGTYRAASSNVPGYGSYAPTGFDTGRNPEY